MSSTASWHTIRDEIADLEQRIDDLTSFHTGTEFQG